jgi:hypothetical protein
VPPQGYLTSQRIEQAITYLVTRIRRSSMEGETFAPVRRAHALEATELLVADERLGEQGADDVLQHVGEVASRWQRKEPRRFESSLVDAVDDLFRAFAERGTAELREAIDEVRRDVDPLPAAARLSEGLEAASE